MDYTKPPINPELRYNRQAVSRVLNVNVNTVDRWRDNGYLTPQKEANKQVTYLGAEILKMWEIRLI
jgi:predicted site-specific integrase-resolvase